MGRIRTIKPEFWKHEVLSSLPESTHILAAALLNYADDEGYFNANVGLIKAECFPLREPSVSIHDSLTHLSNIGYIKLGNASDGRRYGMVVNFEEHQRVNRSTPSKIKDLSISWEDSVRTHTQLTESSLLEGKGREQGKEGNREQESDEFLVSWNENRDSLPEAQKLTTGRKKKLSVRVKEGLTTETFTRAVKLAARTPFCRGENDRGWKLDFDFLIENDTNLTKVLEGKYGPPDKPKPVYREMTDEEASAAWKRDFGVM